MAINCTFCKSAVHCSALALVDQEIETGNR
jgi:hypothetical protein